MNDDQTMAATPHAELIAELMNPNIPKNEREHAAVREIERLREALENPVLEDIEQYCLQMAGICTAAIGYWKDGDNIHPDYNTLALRDVANLYAKYDELYKAQPVQPAQEPAAWQWLDMSIFRKKIPPTGESECWNPLYKSPPQREWVGLTDEEVTEVAQHFTESEGFRHGVDWAEAKLKEKNT